MAYESLQALIGAAVTDSEFRKALLNGSRSHAVKNLDLSDDELAAVMAIRAETLEQFAGQLDQWIMKKLDKVDPPTLGLPIRERLDREKLDSPREPARVPTSTLAPMSAS